MTRVIRGRRGARPTPRHAVKLLSLVVLWSQCVAAIGRPIAIRRVDELAHGIPPRPLQALTGSQFAESISTLDGRQREQAILSEILEGNLPSFLRRLVPKRPSGRTSKTTTMMR